MKNNRVTESPTGMVIRLLTAFMLLMVAFGANADDYCYSLYAKSGATPGTPSCRYDVFGNTPGGMGNYACINNISLIDQWCATPATDEPEQSCPVADPVYPVFCTATTRLVISMFAMIGVDALISSRSMNTRVRRTAVYVAH